jgi:hypothetical protein
MRSLTHQRPFEDYWHENIFNTSNSRLYELFRWHREYCFTESFTRFQTVNRQLKALYRNAIDFITFVKLAAPDFAPEDQLTCEKAVARILRFLDDIRKIEKNDNGLRWLKLCAGEVAKAEKLFDEKQYSGGRKALDCARTYLMNAAARKSTGTTFIASETGKVQDLNSGFPE